MWMRRLVLTIVGLGVIAMALYPPWERVGTTASGVIIARPAGYGWIFAPPPANSSPSEPTRTEIRWFDYQSARDAGYSDDEIANFLSGELQKGEEVYISREDYGAYTSTKREETNANPAAIMPHVRARPLEENIAASRTPSKDDLPGLKGVRVDLARFFVQLVCALGLGLLGFLFPGRRRAGDTGSD